MPHKKGLEDKLQSTFPNIHELMLMHRVFLNKTSSKVHVMIESD